ncbi:DUF421 domain-containing protein [Massilimicrobiota timonensis]|uniref:DUF421 domain-containing protein n=1 Tax=Massilimicrobiota timonensis TaxID=1776392 RepID=UPI00101CDFEC|nr:DUF421 domain-containing protein [Massilimicrobiota timonensis]
MKYIEIFIESFGTYILLVLMIRFLGKKEMSKLSVSDLIVFLIISELMTISIGNENANFLQAALAVLVIVFMDKLFTLISLKSPFFKKMVEGHPTFIVFQGKLNQKKMASLKYSVDDLCHHLREQGIGSLSEVDFAVLETDGQLSVIETKNSEVKAPAAIISDGQINYEILQLMNRDENWLIKKLKEAGIHDYHEVFYCVVEKERLFVIKKRLDN